ncbi:MAG: hypothetical protein K6C68_13655 [Ruminococcus sp.]|nr:hypothetical protein [Ruminococcus sp.]
MFKRFVSGATAFTIALTVSGVSAFADNDGYPDGDEEDSSEIIEEILTDENYLNSDNYIVQELLNELREEEYGLSEIETDLTDPGGVCLPQWSSGGDDESDHAEIAENVRSSLSNELSEHQKLVAMKCMIFSSYTADHDDLHHRKYDDVKKELPSDSVYDKSDTHYVKKVGDKYYYNDKVTQYHAFHNYALTLKALWIYADNVNMISIRNGVYNDKDLRDEVLLQLDYEKMSESEKPEIRSMLNNIHFIFLRYVKDKKITTRNLYKIEMQYLVVGLALHTIGDTYAHRTLVPTYFATDSNEFKEAFKDKPYIDPSKYPVLKDAIKEGTMIPTEFKKYIKD